MADVSRDPGSRQRRRKKRVSRDLEDQTNESLESPSSLPERIPLQEVIDVEKVAVPQSASNNSGEGSSGMQQSTADRRNRGRRPPRRRSRLENGDVYDGIEAHTSTLEMPEKKKYKRPASGVRHVRRSASAEMIDREDDDVRDSENVSPARRRPRRKKAHGSRDVINGEEYNDYDGYGEPTAETSRRSRPRKHKTKKTQRQQNGTSAEEDNYNADVDGEVSVVDFYKVDKEDIVSGEKPGTAPPALPPVAQTLPSQPLDVLFIERRDGHFLKRKAQLMQQDDRHEPQSISTRGQMTTAEFAVNVHRAFRSFSLFCHGLLAGLALCQCIFVYSLSNSLRDNKSGDTIFLENYCKLAQPLQSLYYMLFAICTVSVFDRYDMANPRSGFFHGLLTRPSRILSISAYLFALVFSISVANIDDRISLYEVHGNLWGSEETSSLLETWRIINLMRVLGAVLGWVLVAVQPTKDYTAQNLYEGELLPGEERVIRHRPNNNGTQEAA